LPQTGIGHILSMAWMIGRLTRGARTSRVRDRSILSEPAPNKQTNKPIVINQLPDFKLTVLVCFENGSNNVGIEDRLAVVLQCGHKEDCSGFVHEV
jgi:hypothetical protein